MILSAQKISNASRRSGTIRKRGETQGVPKWRECRLPRVVSHRVRGVPKFFFCAGYCPGMLKDCMSKRLQIRYKTGSAVALPIACMLCLK